ncbi:O-antigen ligase family protein [Psychrobium sp. 1_MG-2023]|uniref:O-antigen ligase family protein n=1 Tax=Psychrobium sp. 1_MG-2023 TaxID=3062624 RepID=UPI000C3269C0|nr:O-antigen ligase family protein [Psychrobium sp. 1_MG-2023]MDP2562089.1 O-antigen ligase family protein [Psychrobium sp. 1_MG-2023]PKF55688.1 hypothetical protein CW748_12605 [Alteromonadales bacterium alter-6D02]
MHWFLVFPKLSIGGQSGILIGELFLVLILARSILFQTYKLRMNVEIKLIACLAFYYFVLSNFSFYTEGIVLGGIIYFCKIFLIILGYGLITPISNQPYDNLNKFIIKPYFILCSISLVIFIAYKIILNPSVGEILWGYSLGARLIPMFGLGLDVINFSLAPIGGGSGNLLGSFSLITLIVICNAKSIDKRYLLIGAIFLFVFLALSRSSLITLTLYMVYFFLFKKRKIITLLLISTLVVTVLAMFGEQISLVNRLTDTVTSKGLDASSMGRVINYIDGFKAWAASPWSVIWGIGSDESLLLEKVHAPLIESFYLGLLYSGGLISILFIFLFMTLIFCKRNNNIYYRYLFEYIVFQSIIQWTLAGGDFWGPVNMYILIVFLALGQQQKLRKKCQGI